MKRIEVVAAIIHDSEGRIFATQRGYGEWKDWWEFPGGKMEVGETPKEALKREIWEELELCAEALKSGHNDPLMRRRQCLLIHQILKLSKINEIVFVIFLMSILACIISWASLRFLPDNFHLGALWIVGAFTLIVGTMTLNLARKLYLHYKKDSTIQ